MQYKKAKLMVVDYNVDRITTKLLTKVLKELNIPIDKLYITSYAKSSDVKNNIKLLDHEIDEIDPKAIIALGKDVVFDLLWPMHLVKKTFKMSDVVGKVYDKIIPCYSCSYVVNHGQKELQDMKDCFTLARKIIFDEVH